MLVPALKLLRLARAKLSPLACLCCHAGPSVRRRSAGWGGGIAQHSAQWAVPLGAGDHQNVRRRVASLTETSPQGRLKWTSVAVQDGRPSVGFPAQPCTDSSLGRQWWPCWGRVMAGVCAVTPACPRVEARCHLSRTPSVAQEQAESRVPHGHGVFRGVPGRSWVPGPPGWFLHAAAHGPSAD